MLKKNFSSFKISNLFGVKDPVPDGLHSCVVYKFVCTLCSADNFHVLDHTSTGFRLKIKEAIHIQREQPSLNQQLHHENLKLSF